ncbi:Sugar phosphate isomerase/epimerase [Selenomonas sp. GACV-9]|nr:Sugar phosphate isomerase/epimerase [Selenomonas ruminantium]
MRIVCSPVGIVEHRRPRGGLERLCQSGFSETVLDFGMFAGGFAGKKRRAEAETHWQEWADRYVEEAKRQGVLLGLAFAPHFESEQKIPDSEELEIRLAEICIQKSAQYSIDMLVVRSLVGGSYAENFAKNREYFLRLGRMAQSAKVRLLVVNSYRNINGHLVRGFCGEPAQAVAFVDEINAALGAEVLGFCLDAGVCNLIGINMYDFVTALGACLQAVILRENDGVHDDSLLPFSSAHGGGSRMDWLNLIRGLRAVHFSGVAVLDFRTTLTALSGLLRPAMLSFAHKVTEYLTWQVQMEECLRRYPSRVLFGAGNMCRAYMKCYGEDFPPLYTCDNNPQVWGKEFCGLSVHAPEDLRSLPEDCAIFICNVYYEEIERQLRDMGLKNPIERFNDEFMPSFHFERLESDGWKEQVKG